MGRLTVDQNNSRFLLDGKPFFYLGDTVWSAFTNITMEEWEYYLQRRRMQGFTVLQINTLPQWDRCMSDTGLYPFATEDGHRFDFSRWDDRYYENAREMCRMAVNKGFQLALVVLWLNYVPKTWGSRITDMNIMPEDFLQEYAERVVSEFDEFHPIYVISGDTDFRAEETISYYRTVLHTVCEKSPDSLKTMHICRGSDILPEEFLDSMDFYMFQSGHNRDGQDMAYVLPDRFRKKYPEKPMINAEPCYEQMGYSRRIYGRFQSAHMRKAAWSSILAGACAGVTYGAHGIWNWKKLNRPVNPVLGEGFDSSFTWQEALQFPGAWDFGWIRQFLLDLGMPKLSPADDLLENETADIRVGVTQDGWYLIYLPYSTEVILKRDLSGCKVRAVDLETRWTACVDCRMENGRALIGMHPFQADALLIVEPLI